MMISQIEHEVKHASGGYAERSRSGLIVVYYEDLNCPLLVILLLRFAA